MSKKNNMNFNSKNNFLIWVLVVIVVIAIVNMVFNASPSKNYDLIEFNKKLQGGYVKELHCSGKFDAI